MHIRLHACIISRSLMVAFRMRTILESWDAVVLMILRPEEGDRDLKKDGDGG
jgi:hypothetical protein